MIREFDGARDLQFLRRCVSELQDTEHIFDPRLPAAEEMADAYCDLLMERCANWNGAIYVAEWKGRRVGLVSIFLAVPETEPDEPPGSYAVISDLVVLPEVRSSGIGAALLARAEQHARDRGVEYLRLEVMAANRSARRFYARRAWRARLVVLEKKLEEGPPARNPIQSLT